MHRRTALGLFAVSPFAGCLDRVETTLGLDDEVEIALVQVSLVNRVEEDTEIHLEVQWEGESLHEDDYVLEADPGEDAGVVVRDEPWLGRFEKYELTATISDGPSHTIKTEEIDANWDGDCYEAMWIVDDGELRPFVGMKDCEEYDVAS